MALTAAERATYQTRLTEAEAALHEALLGRQPKVVVDQNGERVEYSSTNTNRLRAYINELRNALGLNDITGPLKPWF